MYSATIHACFKPGEKEVLNPATAMDMRRIAVCEQAGAGMRMMREEWQKLGRPVPTYNNDRAWIGDVSVDICNMTDYERI